MATPNAFTKQAQALEAEAALLIEAEMKTIDELYEQTQQRKPLDFCQFCIHPQGACKSCIDSGIMF